MRAVAAAVVIAGLGLLPSLGYAQSQTEREVTQTILDGFAYINANKAEQPGSYSEKGALEFWSSGGLLQRIPAGGRPETYDVVNLSAKHITVTALVEGQIAMAHYYSEGMIKPPGAPAVTNYLTRVTQIYVKEGGKWKIRSSHWSAVTGGSGTTQTTLEQ